MKKLILFQQSYVLRKEREKMKENKKIFQKTSNSNKGITLVALVITIVILIILATVAINFAFGNNGLINRASDAKEYYANDTAYTEEALSNVESYIDGIIGENGGSGTDDPTLPDGWDGNKVTPVISADRVTVPVPNGYTASSVATENTVSGGFVVYEGTEAVTDSNVDTAKTSRNQFVWVPVDDISKMAKVTSGIDSNGRTNYQAKLYDFSASGATEKTSYGQETTSYREPDVVTGNSSGTGTRYDGSSTYLEILDLSSSSDFKTQLQEEFNEMIESVDTYGGFYIGRYETGNLASSVGTKPVVVQERTDIGSANWYYQYQNSKLIKANENVESTMIWGNMWDRTLIWLAEENEATDGVNGKSYAEITNSSDWGNHRNNTEEGAGSKQSTGYSENWKTNNIYDLAGNVLDWTIEAYDTYGRVDRGGYYDNSGSNNPASNCGSTSPSYSDSFRGSRSALYVALNAE